MKVSFNWLNNYLKMPVGLHAVSEALTSIGLEVEGVTELFAAFDHLVVGKVLECVPHPNADRLKVTKVDVGDVILQIVCGAHNVAVGQFVVVVLVGKKLTTKQGEVFKIKKSKIRGEISEGMICAEDEIGLGHGHDGIIELEGNPQVGSLVKDWLNIKKDYVIEIGLTPNRTDAFSHLGVCKDLYAFFSHNGYDLEFSLPDISQYKSQSTLQLPIDIKSDNCKKYLGVCIQNVSVQESPVWLQNKLIAIGVKPINNIVDVTNFVLHETGNPLHAFDYDKISSKLTVRSAKKSEEFKTLDNKDLKLDSADLVIADDKKALCLAGVIGGANSGVDYNTKNVFLESAFFDAESVRKTSKRYSIMSDSSYRFERGVDFNNCDYALKRAALLIKELSNGSIGLEAQFQDDSLLCKQIDFSFESCNSIIGHTIKPSIIEKILISLGFDILNSNHDGLRLGVPSSRSDVYREIDVVEEVLRIYGYDHVPPKDHIKYIPSVKTDISNYDIKYQISEFLSMDGFFEIKNNSLVSASSLQLFNQDIDDSSVVKLLNPLSQDLLVMRQNMFFSGLEAMKYNLNRQVNNLKFFEFGKTYSCDREGRYVEIEKLTILSCGVFSGNNWHQNTQKTDFFLIKGVLQKLFDKFLPNHHLNMRKTTNKYSELALSYCFDNQELAELGKFSRNVLHKFNIKQPVYYIDINVDLFFSLFKTKTKVNYQPVCKFPSVKRDLSIVVNKSVNYSDIKDSIMQKSSELLQEIILFDVYEGDKIENSHKSYAISFVFNHKDRTLTDLEVDKQMLTIYNYLVEQYAVSLRDGELKLV